MAAVAHRSIDSYPVLSAGALTAMLAFHGKRHPAEMAAPR